MNFKVGSDVKRCSAADTDSRRKITTVRIGLQDRKIHAINEKVLLKLNF
jgi:hypothetical protein